jgi:hypothetical protein
MIRAPGLTMALAAVAILIHGTAGVAAEPVLVPLPAPARIELYLDGLRLDHAVPVGPGRTRIPLPATEGSLIGVDGADAWVVESRLDRAEPPPAPPLLRELAAGLADLVRSERLVAAQEEAATRIAAELGQRIGQRAVDHAGETAAWQDALDGLIALRARIDASRQELLASRRVLRERAAAEAAPGLTFAAVLGLDLSEQGLDFADGEPAAIRAWRAALASSALTRTLIIERALPGTVTVVTERSDAHWTPRARLLVAKGAATLVRQAVIQVPAGLVLAALPARLVGGTRAQPLIGAALVPRVVTAGSAPVAERRSVTTTSRAAGWSIAGNTVAAREQSWELKSLALSAPGERAAEVMAELQKGQVTLIADEWVLAPELAPLLVRRLSVRLDAQPLAAGMLELVVDGGVLGRRELPSTAAGTVLQLAAGEDQRVFLAEAKHWDEDPNRPVNRKRDGGDYRFRNLSGDTVRFACYLTRPVSAAKGVAVTIDPATTPGWQEAQAGIVRWELSLKPGEELLLRNGWVIEAEGKIRL